MPNKASPLYLSSELAALVGAKEGQKLSKRQVPKERENMLSKLLNFRRFPRMFPTSNDRFNIYLSIYLSIYLKMTFLLHFNPIMQFLPTSSRPLTFKFTLALIYFQSDKISNHYITLNSRRQQPHHGRRFTGACHWY